MAVSKRIMIAKRVAEELNAGDLVNLGIGMPTLVSNFVKPEKHIVFQSENGLVGISGVPEPGEEDYNLTDAGGMPAKAEIGACFFDTLTSFTLIRGGHVDATVLGAMEVDQKGNLANYMIPEKLVAGMGGAMDLANGAKKVIVMTEHCNKHGQSKILKECTLPLTAVQAVDIIVTDMAVIEVKAGALVVKEIAASTTLEAVLNATDADLVVDPDLKIFGEEL
ncbi:3-oxoacid CoA-transferase subunit B [Pseudovibrio exalbescens]|uniref:3-oxoacid CoA-transferase subunit B n=1 Tax=Pseudovibrio exalbescens TaxID=197461 RepID=UPI000C9A6D50|nr:3-oxoacid CoA-transferase subunit B [Pseudovibrio exalbescens]